MPIRRRASTSSASGTPSNEQRRPFEPTLWEQHDQAQEQTLKQVWFVGVHSDVGGGYSQPELAEIPLLWMVGRARAAGLPFVPDRLVQPDAGLDEKLRHLGIQVAPDPLGPMHDSLKGFYRLFDRRRRAPAGDGASAASSAIRRRDQAGDYDPPELSSCLAAGGGQTPVEDVG
jgi:T6SS, Phospholipase effector Tle1-like, catalytic domain